MKMAFFEEMRHYFLLISAQNAIFQCFMKNNVTNNPDNYLHNKNEFNNFAAAHKFI